MVTDAPERPNVHITTIPEDTQINPAEPDTKLWAHQTAEV